MSPWSSLQIRCCIWFYPAHHLESFPIFLSVSSSRCMVFAKDRDVFCPIITCSWVSPFSSQDCSWGFLGSVEREPAEEACWGRSLLSLSRCYSLNLEKLKSFNNDLRHLNSLLSERSFRNTSISNEYPSAKSDRLSTRRWPNVAAVFWKSVAVTRSAWPNASRLFDGSEKLEIANSLRGVWDHISQRTIQRKATGAILQGESCLLT